MEHAYFLKRMEKLERIDAKFKRVYFGSEFCEQLTPNVREIEKVIDWCKSENRNFTFVTPFCTDHGVKMVLEAVSALRKNDEVVFNDWGVFEALKDKGFSLVMGRVICKQNKDPRLCSTEKNKVPSYYKDSVLSLSRFQAFLLEKNIRRAEIDNVHQGHSFNIKKEVSLSIHYPFVFVTATRKCLFNIGKEELAAGSYGCGYWCKSSKAMMKFKSSDRAMVIKGNAKFYFNDTMPASLKEKNVDRLVFSDEA